MSSGSSASPALDAYPSPVGANKNSAQCLKDMKQAHHPQEIVGYDRQAASTSPKPGDNCPKRVCDGWLEIYTSRNDGEFQTRYMRCWKCRCKESRVTQIVPAELIVRRRKRIDT